MASASKNIVVDLNKGEKPNGDNYDILPISLVHP